MNLGPCGSTQYALPVTADYHCPVPTHPSGRWCPPGVPAEAMALAEAAAVETAARLSRHLPVRVVAADNPVERGSGLALLVLLGEPAAAVTGTPEWDTPAVLFRIRVDTGGVTVRACTAEGDPWARGLVAVAEIFAELLAALLAQPRLTPVLAAGIGAASRDRVLRRYAGRPVDHGAFQAIPDMIRRQVDRHPERPAVTFNGQTLSYRELDELSNGLAATLTTAGLRRGAVVPVLLADGLELPVAWLALMGLGVAFVPCDPDWPVERIRGALDVLDPPLVLCADADQLPEPYRRRAVVVRADRIARSSLRPGIRLHPDELIYGIFTSGTTGLPKCAMNRHAGLTNRFRFMNRYFGSTGAEVVLQNSRHTFDSAVWQLFWPLTTGGRTVVPARGGFLDLPQTIDIIHAEQVTITDFVPSVFNLLVAMVEEDPAALARIASLRHLVIGGEEINPQMTHRLRALLPDLEITNGYGPTEASIGMIFHRVSTGDGTLIPLGRPIDNCYAVVTDARLRPLPPGATGEIVIGGACLGTGYLAAPGRTAEAFVPNPFPEIPGDRLYRTGDLGYLDDQGRFRFLGRRDAQVKINGVRIELGEIETTAESCPGVRQARALSLRRDTSAALALFVAGDGTLTEAVLRAHLCRTLPRNSQPQHCYVLPELPLTHNGKVDRRELHRLLEERLAHDSVRLAAEAEPVDLPGQVLRVFRTVLRQPDLAADTGFIEAGGDSFQALAVVSALSASTGVRLGVPDLFDRPSASDLAELIARRRADPVSGTGAVASEDALIAADLILPTSVTVLPAYRPTPLRRVLLTGATGFVGSRLAYQLLRDTDIRLSCCTRAPDDATATARVRQALVERGLWRESFAERIEGYAADLTRPGLGLPGPTWEHLARSCDLILHNGALVNFLFDYRAHRPANVSGTLELLRLAMHHRPKPLHYISTLGVLDTEAARRGEPLVEQHDLADAVRPERGYSRSKWVAERLLAEACRRGATVTVFRLGEVMPAADNGQPNQLALTHLLLSGFHRLGMSPATEIRSDYTPVDHVADRVCAAVTDPGAWGRTLHVLHPESVCFADVLSRVGAPIKRVTCTEFLAALRDEARHDGDRLFGALLALLPPDYPDDEAGLRRVFSGLLTDNPRLFRQDQCRRLAQRWGLTDDWLYPPISAYHAWLKASAAGRPAAPAEPQTTEHRRTGGGADRAVGANRLLLATGNG